MDADTAEKTVYLYDTLAPLGEALEDESPGAPSSGFTDAGLLTISQTAMDVSTSPLTATELQSFTTSSAVVTVEEPLNHERSEATYLSRSHDLALPNYVEEDPDTDISKRIVEIVDVEASEAHLTTSGKAEEVDFLSLDVDGLGETTLEVQAVLAEEEKLMTSDIGKSAVLEAPPWARSGNLHDICFRSPFLQLHQEIVDFCNFVAPTEEEQHVRAAAVQRVSEVIKSIWPSCQVKVFGSFATGLFLPSSDCDVLFNRNVGMVVILESGCQVPQDGLKAIAKALNRKSLVRKLQVIGKARVPIVKFVETESNISFDISFDVANGPDAAEFIRDAMAALPPLKPLCLVLKFFLQQRELNEVYTGGIGSYALLVMLLTHLQMHPSRKNKTNRGEPCPLESNLGILLVDFFDFYGHALNVRDVGISCRSGGRFYSKISRGFLDSGRPYLLSVEDPQAPDNDIGKNSYNVTKVRAAFLLAHRLLTRLEVEDVPAHVGLLGRIVHMDEHLRRRKAIVPELPHRSDSQVKLASLGPSICKSSSTVFYSESETYMPGPSSGSRWLVCEDDDFPRGGEPEFDQKVYHKRKHTKVRTGDGQADGSMHSSHRNYHHKRKREDFETGGSSSGNFRRSRRRMESASPVAANSPLSNSSSIHERGREMLGSGDALANHKKIPQHRKSQKRGMNAHEDMFTGRRTPDGKKNRWRKQGGLETEFHERRDAILRDDVVTVHSQNGQEEGEGVAHGTGNGQNKHKRWFNEVRLQRPPRRRPEHRTWIPEGEDGEGGRSSRRVVITKPAHKKIKYL